MASEGTLEDLLAQIAAEDWHRPSSDELSRLVSQDLEANPDHREQIVDAAEEANFALEWSQINGSRASMLAIVYAFTPWNATSGLVAARRIRERGSVCDVVCNSLGGKRDTDVTSKMIAAPWVAEQHVVDHAPHFTNWSAVAAFCEGTFKWLESRGKSGTYSDLYSRATWAASHIAAAQYKLRNPEVRWVAEMSDPLSRTIMGEVRVATMRRGPIVMELRRGLLEAGFDPPSGIRLFEWAEILPYALADEIIFTNEHQLEFMMSYCDDPRLRERVRSIATIAPHPIPPPQMYDAEPTSYDLDPRKTHLAYFGVFYATRGLTEVTSALRSLSGEEREMVQMHVFTNKPDETIRDVDSAGLSGVIIVNGYRPYLGFLNLTRKFDVLVVNDSDTRDTHAKTNPYLPSKVSDYLGSGTPVWGICEEGSVLSSLELAYKTRIADDAAAAMTVRRIIGRMSQGQVEN